LRPTSIGDRFAVYARGHHGYPQPEKDYRRNTYETSCPNCGWHGEQIAPFAVRRGLGAPHSTFVQLNWVFDAWFVSADAAEILTTSGLTGFSFERVLDIKTQTTIESHRQLAISNVVPCLDVSHLPQVTCRADNEESTLPMLGGTRPNPAEFCGRVKHHPPTTVGLYSDLRNDQDVVLCDEWVGSRRGAFRLTIASRRFVDFVRMQHWRGLEFLPVIVGAPSERRDRTRT
jgi:hypothetical protein